MEVRRRAPFIEEIDKRLNSIDKILTKSSSPISLKDIKKELKRILNAQSQYLTEIRDMLSKRDSCLIPLVDKQAEIIDDAIKQASNIIDLSSLRKFVDHFSPIFDIQRKEWIKVAPKYYEEYKEAILKSDPRKMDMLSAVWENPTTIPPIEDVLFFIDKELSFSNLIKWINQQPAGSSPLAPQATQAQKTDLKTGGIDFTRINYLTKPMGSFQGLDLRLPLLSKAELEGMDINRELSAIEQMVNAKIDVSTDRLKRLLAAMSQKDVFTSQRETQLLPLLLRLCWLKEEKGADTTPDFRSVLLIADTGLFVEQGNTRYSLN